MRRAGDRTLYLTLAAYAIAVVVLAAAVRAAFGRDTESFPTTGGSVQIAQVVHRVAGVLDTTPLRQSGVLGHPITGSDALGFKWATASTESFWMKDVPYPLVLVVVAHNSRVSFVAQMKPCMLAAPLCPLYTPPPGYRLAFELLPSVVLPVVGDRVSFPPRVVAAGGGPALSGLAGGVIQK